MSQPATNIYGPGTFVDTSFTTVPDESARILRELAAKTPAFTQDQALIDGVSFEGSDLPCIPGPLKSQAFTSALHAMAGIVGHEILQLRGVSTDKKIAVLTDQVGMYLATPVVVSVDGVDGPEILKNSALLRADHGAYGTPLKLRSQGIYETRTQGVWFQLHGSTFPDPVLRAIGVDPECAVTSVDEAYRHIEDRVKQYSARELEMMMVERGLAGSIVYSPAGWLTTTMGATLAKHSLVNYKRLLEGSELGPVQFPPLTSGDKRPLSGIRVLELSRIIAGPACGAVLAAMGAEVIRVQAGRQVDFTPAQFSLMAGKRNYEIDIDKPHDKQILLDLMFKADIIIQGYRLRSLERRGLGLQTCLELANRRGKGIVYLDENCYGPDGYYAERPGWQQVADAAAGSSYVTAKGYGWPEGQGVLPSLPISDMSTGVLAAIDILMMIRDRAKFGGSYHGTASLVAYNATTLQDWVGLYQPEVVQRIQQKFEFPAMTSDLHVIELYELVYKTWKKAGQRGNKMLADEKFFTHFGNSPYGKDLRIVAPIVRYGNDETTPRWSIPPMPFCYHKDPRWETGSD